MHRSGQAVREAAATIRRYLIAHPNAADSEQGIADWWVASGGVQATLEDVCEALDLLHREGTVETQQLADGRRIYRAARHAGDDRN